MVAADRPEEAVVRQFAMGLILDGDERLLIARHPPGGLHAGLWSFPAGELVADESPERALQRNLRETLALTIGVVEQLPAYPLTVGGEERRYHPLVCTMSAPPAKLADDPALRLIAPQQIDEFRFAPPDSVTIRLILELYDRR